MRFIILAWATGLGFGYFPKMPGSVGTLWGVGLFYLFQYLSRFNFGVILIVLSLIGVWASTMAEGLLGHKDDQRIVIDEIVGFLFAVIGFSFRWDLAVAAYILFRLFDIFKPFPINWLQDNLPGGWGVMADDVMAGLCACLVLHLLRHFFGVFS